MTRLARITQPIFAGNAPQEDTAVFGTMKTTPVYTTNVAQSINTPIYGEGWKSAIELGYAPFIEDMNTVQRELSYQIAYSQQEGICEWGSDTEYSIGSVVKLNTATGAQIYVSKTNNNVGNLLSNTTHWKIISDSTSDLYANPSLSNLNSDGQEVLNSIVPTGVILPFAGLTPPYGFLMCDGTAISRTNYSRLFSVIGTSYGSGDGSTTFNLPNFRDKFLQGASATNTIGTVKEAGLPNITGSVASERFGVYNSRHYSGAFTVNRGTGYGAASNTGETSMQVDFAASASNSIYGNSTTVQPPAVCVNYVIKY